MLSKQGLIKTVNETLWCVTVEQVRIKEDDTMWFIFKDGAFIDEVITIGICKKTYIKKYKDAVWLKTIDTITVKNDRTI